MCHEGYREVIHLQHMLLPASKHLIVDTQFGSGLNCGDTGVARIYVKCLGDLAMHNNVSMCTLFIDIVTAFASLLRHIVFDIDCGDEKWLQSLGRAGFSDIEIESIYRELCTSIWNATEANTVSVALASCMYQYTWASTEGLSNVIQTITGSMAGTPLADLMYVLAISKVMVRC